MFETLLVLTLIGVGSPKYDDLVMHNLNIQVCSVKISYYDTWHRYENGSVCCDSGEFSFVGCLTESCGGTDLELVGDGVIN